MDGIAQWLANISWPLITRIMASLGIGTVSYMGAESALSGAINTAKSAFLGAGQEMMAVLVLSGFFDAMSIMSGGLVSALSWIVLKKYAVLSMGNT